MLHSLHIRDLALIESAEIRFDRGFNVISGETGGGKSLVITALQLLRGGKASAGLVRHGAKEMRVDGEFALGTGQRSAAVRDLVMDLVGEPPEDGMILVTRIVDAGGRSKARLNGRPTTLAALRELGGWLVEIHGQGETQALMRPEIQCETLDAFAGTVRLRESFAAELAAARGLRQRLADVQGASRERLQRVEFLRFQLAELEDLGLTAGETADLEEEHRVLANLDGVRESLQTAVDALVDGEPSAGGLLARAERAVGAAAESDRALEEASELCAELRMQVDDLSRTLQSRLGSLDLDAGRLGAVEERLAAVRSALHRFGPTEADLLENIARFRAELEELDGDERGAEELATDLREAVQACARTGRKLLRARRKAAAPFAKAIEKELTALGMPHARLQLGMADDLDADRLLDDATAHGPAPVDFLVQINPGLPPQSLRETASGGETARIVLAIKKCLADQDRVPFLAFDEIDAEIGGRLGLAVGAKLAEVAADHQVLIVTHLPQVAAFADAHIRVMKSVADGTTRTLVERLEREQADEELAAMAGAEGADRSAVEEARKLVRRARSG